MIVDAHQHFWDPARGDYSWLTPDLPICRPFGPNDLWPLLERNGVDATILVQAAPTVAETDHIIDIARATDWVLGVVGWIALDAPAAVREIRRRANDPLFLGVRPMLQDIADPNWILSPQVVPALAAIAAEGLVFDALVRPHQIGAIVTLAQTHPDLTIVLDHAAKPLLGDAAATAAWTAAMWPLAALPNVCCKLSGLITELAPGGGRQHLEHAIADLLDLFGPRRLLWGSDWPVLAPAGDYGDWLALVKHAIAAQAPDAVDAILGGNALRIYRPSISRAGEAR